jgi:Uma2 family endonuclease
MTAMPPLLTPDDLLAMPEDGHKYELVDGRLKERNVSKESSRAGLKVGRFLDEYCDDHGGWAYGSDLGYRCFPDENRVRFADASYVSLGAMPVETYTDEGYCSTVPDLVAEVISPNDLAREVDAKIVEWLSVGVKVVWVLQPETNTIRIHRHDGSYGFLTEKETLAEPGLLPGFSVPLADIFRRQSPPN